MHRRRPLLVTLLVLATALGLVGAGGAWWYRITRPEYRLRRGQQALRRANRDEAERRAAQLDATGSKDHARLLRGEIFFRSGQYNRAVAELNQLEDQGAIRLEAAALFGQWFLQLRELEKAELLLRYVVEQQPDHADAHRGLAALYYDQRAWVPAVLHLIEVTQLDPRDGRPYRFMGLIYKDLDQITVAINAYQEALRRQLTDQVAEEVKQELAECLVAQARYAEAFALLEGRQPLPAQAAKLLALRVECLWGLDGSAEAQAVLDQARAAHPESLELLRVQARLWLNASKAREAATLLEQILERDPQDFASRHQLAQAYERLGRPAEAGEQRQRLKQTQDALAEMTQLVQKASENPWDAAVRKELAELCQKLDRPDLAALWLRAASACPAAPTSQQQPAASGQR